MTQQTQYDPAQFSVERESLIAEARKLLADAGDGALDETASQRFTEIEQRLEAMSNEAAERPAFVDPTRQPLPGGTDPGAQFGVHTGPPSLEPSQNDMVELFNAAREGRPARVGTPASQVQFATVGTSTAGSPDVWQVPDRSRGGQVRRLSNFVSLTSQRIAWGASTVFPVYGAGSAAVAGENTLKAEYDNISPGTAEPQTIAAWTDITGQAGSLAGFESRLRLKLSALIARREDQLLTAKVTGTTGIQTHTGATGEAPSDSLLAAAALVVDSDVGAEPDAAVIHPDDVLRIFGGSFGTSGETPEAALRLNLHGLACYVSSSVTAGTALVGSWRAASALVIGLDPVFKVDPYSQMKSNITTLLGEEAVDLMVDEPSGFVNVTFAAAA